MSNELGMTTMDVMKVLRMRHNASRRGKRTPREWAYFEELRAGTGYASRKRDFNPERYFDAWAINLYPSKGHRTIAYEVKVSRADFLREIKDPSKRREALMFSNEFYFVAPKGLLDPKEIPEECGLIEVTHAGSRIKKHAAFRPDVEPTWNFLASIARRSETF